MAVHILHVIDDILEKQHTSTPEQQEWQVRTTKDAIDGESGAPWVNGLEIDDWDRLRRAVTRGYSALVQWADDHRQRYTDKWLDLGMPENHNDWQSARWNARRKVS